MNTWKNKFSLEKLADRHVYLVLAGLCLLGRLPFVKTFELVAYDGTYYLNQAKTLFSSHMSGAFPIGYPLVVKLFQIVLRDYQLAGMAVSFTAGIGSVIVTYLLARRFVRREFAFLAAVTLALNPLATRLSLMTLSESLYTFWVLLGLLFFTKSKWANFGLTMGIAAITRPEALAIAGLLGISRLRILRPGKLAAIAGCFLAVYALNTAVLSVNTGRLVLLPKSKFFGSSTSFWKQREASIGFEGKEKIYQEMASQAERTSVMADYVKRLPGETWIVVKHVLPAIFLFALFAFRRKKYLFFASALVSFFVIPLVTVRSIDRYIFPYIPVLILLAVLAIAGLKNRRLRIGAACLVFATIVILPVFNKAVLLVPEEPDLLPAKKAGLEYRDQVNTTDNIADRKPFFAFYSGGRYVEIPVAPYEDVMQYLVGEKKVKFLSLHKQTIHRLRPALRPLLYDRAVINGELRFRQEYFDPDGEMVLRKISESEPLRWNRMTPKTGNEYAPAWSPDGKRIAYRLTAGDGTGGIYSIDFSGGRWSVPRKLADVRVFYDQLSWSPDGRRIAFANGEPGAMNILAVNTETGNVEELVKDDLNNISPSWSMAGDELAFCSDRSGQAEIWTVRLPDGSLRQISTGGSNTNPVISPGGDMIAWVKKDRCVMIHHGPSGRTAQFSTPGRVSYTPAWHPGGRYLAVTAEDWGSWDIYLVKTDGSNALLLTKNTKRDIMPAWSPDGTTIALISEGKDEEFNLWTIQGLEPYLDRLESGEEVKVFDETRERGKTLSKTKH